jgi:hypothetical protein
VAGGWRIEGYCGGALPGELDLQPDSWASNALIGSHAMPARVLVSLLRG